MESEKLTLADLGKPILTIDALKEDEFPEATNSKAASEESPLPVSLTGEEQESEVEAESAVNKVDTSDECSKNDTSNVETSGSEQPDTSPDVKPTEVIDLETQALTETADGNKVKNAEPADLVGVNVEEPVVSQVDSCDEQCGKNDSSNVETSGAEQVDTTLDDEPIEVLDQETQTPTETADGADVPDVEATEPPASQADPGDECVKNVSPMLETFGSEDDEQVEKTPDGEPIEATVQEMQVTEPVDGTEIQNEKSKDVERLNAEVAILDIKQHTIVSSDGIDNVEVACAKTRPEDQTMQSEEEAPEATESPEQATEPDQNDASPEDAAAATGDESCAKLAPEDFASCKVEEKGHETENELNQESKEVSRAENSESSEYRRNEIEADNEAKPEFSPEEGESADINTNIDEAKSTLESHSVDDVTESNGTKEVQNEENKAVGSLVLENCVIEQTSPNEKSGLEVDVTTSAIDKESKEVKENDEQTELYGLITNATALPEGIQGTTPDMTEGKSSLENSGEVLDEKTTEEETRQDQINKDSNLVDKNKLQNSRPEPDGYRPDPSDDDSCLRHFTESTELAAKTDKVPDEKDTDSMHSSKPDPPPDPPEVLRIENSFHDEPSNNYDDSESPITEGFQVKEKLTECQIEQVAGKSKESNTLRTDEPNISLKSLEITTKDEHPSEQHASSDLTSGPVRKENSTDVGKCSDPSPINKVTSPQMEFEDEYEEEIIDESEVSYEEFLIDDESEVDDYFEEIIEDNDDDDLFTEETYNSKDENDTEFVTTGNSAAPLAEGRRTVARTKSADELGRRTVIRNKSIREKELENEIARKREEALKYKKDVEYRIARQNSFAEKDFDFLRKLAEEEAEHIREEEERERKRREEEAEMARIKAEEAAILIAQQEKEELRKRLMEEEERRKAAEAEAHRLAAERAAKEKEALEKARREFEEEERRKREEKKKEMEAEVRALQAKLEEAKRAAIEAKKKQKEEKERLRAKVDARRKIKKEKAPANTADTENMVHETSVATVPKSPEQSSTPAVVEMVSPEKRPTPTVAMPESPVKTTSTTAPRSPYRSPKKTPATMQLPESTPVAAPPDVSPTPPSPKKPPVEKSPVVAPPPPPKAPAQESSSPGNATPASSDEPTEYYTVEQLRKQSIPGLDYKNREKYLSPEDFQAVLGVTKAEFETFPKWKQTNLKRKNKLF